MCLSTVINNNHATHLRQLGIEIKSVKYDLIPIDTQVIIISDEYSDSECFSFVGFSLATDLRLAGYSLPIVLLSFLNRQQLTKFDPYGILQDQTIYVKTLPVIRDEFMRFNASLKEVKNRPSDYLNLEMVFQKRFGELFSIFMHGKSIDLINKITGPLRAACIIAQFYPEKEFLVWDMVEKTNQHLTGEASIQKLFFITHSSSLTKVNKDVQLSLDFVLLLKELTVFKPAETDLLKLIAHIDNLNKVFFELIKKNG